MAITEIKPVTRIEGDAKLELDTYVDGAGKLRAKNSLTPNNGTIAIPTNSGTRYPKFCVTEFRGFEKMVLGETPENYARLVPRVCGVCPVQHSVAASTAIEAAFGVTVSSNATAIRRLMIASSTVHSHLLHMLIMAGRDFLPHATLDSELANMIAAHNKTQSCVAVFGGKPVHSAACLPGGQTRVPTANDLSQMKARMLEVNGYLTSIMGTLKSGLMKIPTDVGTRPASFLSSGIPFYTGVSGSYVYGGNSGGVLLRNSTAPGDFTASALVPFTPANLKEEVVTPAGSITSLPDKYSYARRPYYAYNGTNYVVEVGPLARIAVAYRAGDPVVKPKVDGFASSWGLAVKDMLAPNTRNRHIARLLETQVLIDRIANAWVGAVSQSTAYGGPARRAGSGVGVVEAPRGTLVHNVTIGSGLALTACTLTVPTTINAPAIEEAVADDLVEIGPEAAALLKSGESATDVNLKLLLGDASRTVRGFDPCCSCSSHLLKLKLPDGAVRHHP